MDVEIDHRDAVQVPGGARMMGGDGGVVEQAEPHRSRRLRMVARRAGGGEGGTRATAHDCVDRGDGTARRAQCGLCAAGAHRCVGVELHGLRPFRPDRENGAHILGGVSTGELLLGGGRSGLPDQRRKRRVVERGEHGAQTVGTLRVPGAGIVTETGRVGKQGNGHDREHSLSPRPAGGEAR